MLFKFFNRILSLFKSKHIVSLVFRYDNNHNVFLSMNYNNKPKFEDIASIIYALNNGLFLDKIVNILLADTKNNKKNVTAHQILSQLDSLYVIDRQHDLIVKPLEAFEKNVKQ